MSWFGQSGSSFFDRWTLVHLAFWLVIGANFQALHIPHAWRWPALVVGAYIWEVIELTLERKTDLVGTTENWLNRWVSDPLMAVIGGAVGMALVY